MPLQRGITAGERSRGNSRALSLVEKLGVCLFVRSSTWSRVLLKLQGHTQAPPVGGRKRCDVSKRLVEHDDDRYWNTSISHRCTAVYV